jgi:hypothetical protein
MAYEGEYKVLGLKQEIERLVPHITVEPMRDEYRASKPCVSSSKRRACSARST